MARTRKIRTPITHNLIPVLTLEEKKANFEISKRHWVEYREKSIQDTVAVIAKRLRSCADDVERAGRDILSEETQWSSMEDRARRILHDVMWMVPNLPLENLLKDVEELRKAQNSVFEDKPSVPVDSLEDAL